MRPVTPSILAKEFLFKILDIKKSNTILPYLNMIIYEIKYASFPIKL